jgi:membrane fusion protein (multidrug efflux system)
LKLFPVKHSIKLFILSSLAVLLYLSGCHSEKKAEAEEVYQATRPIRLDTIMTREYVCQIQAIQHIEVRALENGYLENIYIDEGKPVKKGQLLFSILPVKYKAEFQKAEAEARYVAIEYQQTKLLADSNVISPVQLALAKAKLEKANAELELAKVHLGFTEIKAPFDGLVDRFQVRLGSLLKEGDLLTKMSDISQLWVYFNVPEAEYLDYKRGVPRDSALRVRLRMANGQLFDYPGIVKTIEADFNNETGNIAFRATFPNPNGLLRHGETGNIVVTVPLRNALIIPQKATYEVLDQKYVYVLDKDNVLKARRITVSAEMPDLYVVGSGLSPDDRILLEGLRKVKEGQKIKAENKDPRMVIARLKLRAE